MARCYGALLLSCALLHLTGAVEVTPVQQVINMLTEMKIKGEEAAATEQKVMAEYTKWANDLVRELGYEMKTLKSEIEELVAFIDQADSDVANLGREIKHLEGEIAQLEGDKHAAKQQRNEENTEFLKNQKDYAESVEALEGAIQAMAAQAYNRPQAQMLLQKMATKVHGMQRVLALINENEDEVGAPQVAAYDFQSDTILKLLEGLLKKFKGELDDVEKAEANQRHAYELTKLHLSDTIAHMSANREEKIVLKGKRAAASAEAKGQLTSTRTDLAEDEKRSQDTQATYKIKEAGCKENQQVRADELVAINKAIEIISSPQVAQSYGTHINLVEQSSKAVSPRVFSFLQEKVHMASAQRSARSRAAELLEARAKALSSKVLEAAAASAAANPFAKVISMVENLLARLKEEALAEADHKAWCDKQLHDNKLRREKRAAKVDRLTAEIQEYGAQIQTMADEIKTLSEEQATLTKEMSKATALREEERAINLATIKDAQVGAHAVKKALVILREFYSSQEEAFLQQVPEMAAYKGMQNSKGGVVGMLEVIVSDFNRLEADTTTAETGQAQQYATFMSESKASKKLKHDREFQLKLEKDEAEFEQSRLQKELALTQEELDKSNAYYEYLKPPCVTIHVSYEERVARRKEEIEALKQAYAILDEVSVGK